MEEIGATIPKYQPLQVLWHPLCDYAQRTILSHPIRLFTRQLVPSLFEYINILNLIHISSTILLIQPYKCLPVTIKIFMQQLFFSLFSSHTFSGACGSFCEPWKFFQIHFIHSLVCLITHSFLHGFQPNLYQHFSYVCSTCHTIISLK